MKVYRLVVKDRVTNKEIFLAKFNKETQAKNALAKATTITNSPNIEFYILTAEVIEKKK